MKKWLLFFALLSGAAYSMEKGGLEITVRTLRGVAITVGGLGAGSTVRDLKKKIYEMTRIDQDLQKIVFAGRSMADDESLEDFATATTIHLIVPAKVLLSEKKSCVRTSAEQAADNVLDDVKNKIGEIYGRRSLREESFYEKIQILIVTLDHVLNAELPASYAVEVFGELKSFAEKNGLVKFDVFEDDLIHQPKLLADLAMEFLNKYYAGVPQEEILQWKDKVHSRNDYIRRRIGFTLTLRKILEDETIFLRHRFFIDPDFREQFIKLLNSQEEAQLKASSKIIPNGNCYIRKLLKYQDNLIGQGFISGVSKSEQSRVKEG